MEISDNFDNTGKDKMSTIYGQTVLATPEVLSRLPTEIFQIWGQYQLGELSPCTPEEVKQLLTHWYQGDTHSILSSSSTSPSPHDGICELSIDTSASDSGLITSRIQKRRRVNSHL